jgi:hypothetical protein
MIQGDHGPVLFVFATKEQNKQTDQLSGPQYRQQKDRGPSGLQKLAHGFKKTYHADCGKYLKTGNDRQDHC